MPTDAASLAPSDATTLVDDQAESTPQRTTLTGKPIERQHDHLSNLMTGDGGGFASGSAGANLLPPAYTDNSLVRIPIKMSDVDGSELKPAKKRGLFGRKSSASDDMKIVMMSRGDYLKYWVKGEDGNFLSTVSAPPEGRKEWLRKQLELNEEWKKTDATERTKVRLQGQIH